MQIASGKHNCFSVALEMSYHMKKPLNGQTHEGERRPPFDISVGTDGNGGE